MSPTGKFLYWDFMGGQRKIFWGCFFDGGVWKGVGGGREGGSD